MTLPKTYFSLDMEISKGDPIIIPLVFEDEDGVAVDITSWDFYYTLKASLSDTDANAVATLRPDDPGIVKSADPVGGATTNRVDLIVESAALTALVVDTTYYHDIQVVPGDGRTYTYAKGTLKPTYEVTEDTP